MKSPRGEEIRPTADRLKETLFDILGSRTQDAFFLDVFAGSGAVGLEAISRGASLVVFIENSREGNRVIRQNLELCRIQNGYRIIRQDAFSALRQLAREGCSMDLIFMDPPYDFEPYADLLAIVFGTGLAREHAQVVIEHTRWAVLPESGERYHRARLLRQGDHCLSFYRSGQ